MTRPETAETRARRRQRAIMCWRVGEDIIDARAQSTVIKMRCREQIYSFLNTITVLLKYENAAAFRSAHSASRSLT